MIKLRVLVLCFSSFMNNFIQSEFFDFLRTMTTYPNQQPMITANYLAMRRKMFNPHIYFFAIYLTM